MKRLSIVKEFGPALLSAALSAIASSASANLASPVAVGCQDIPALKVAYLRCENGAQSDTLNAGSIAYCSQVYYRLKARAFDNDFTQIRDWYDLMVSSGTLARYSNLATGPATEPSRCD